MQTPQGGRAGRPPLAPASGARSSTRSTPERSPLKGGGVALSGGRRHRASVPSHPPPVPTLDGRGHEQEATNGSPQRWSFPHADPSQHRSAPAGVAETAAAATTTDVPSPTADDDDDDNRHNGWHNGGAGAGAGSGAGAGAAAEPEFVLTILNSDDPSGAPLRLTVRRNDDPFTLVQTFIRKHNFPAEVMDEMLTHVDKAIAVLAQTEPQLQQSNGTATAATAASTSVPEATATPTTSSAVMSSMTAVQRSESAAVVSQTTTTTAEEAATAITTSGIETELEMLARLSTSAFRDQEQEAAIAAAAAVAPPPPPPPAPAAAPTHTPTAAATTLPTHVDLTVCHCHSHCTPFASHQPLLAAGCTGAWTRASRAVSAASSHGVYSTNPSCVTQ